MINRQISEITDSELLDLARSNDLAEILDEKDLAEAMARIGHLITPTTAQEETIEISLD